MNVYYISKYKKLCDDEKWLCLLQIKGVRRGWKIIDSEAGGWIKGLVVGDEETLLPLISNASSSPRMNVYYISKYKKLCGYEKRLCLLQIEGVRRGQESINSEAGGCIKGLVVVDKIIFLPLHQHFFLSPLG